MSVADQIHSELAGAGTLDSVGRFEIDERAAIAKLRVHQLENPHDYIAHLVDGATLAGAVAVDVTIDGPELTLSFVAADGAALPEARLIRLLSVLVADVPAEGGPFTRPAMLALAVGVNAALGLPATEVVVTSVDAQGRGHEVRLGKEQPEHGPITIGQPGTRIVVRGRGSAGYVARDRDVQQLRRRCHYAVANVTLYGSLLSYFDWVVNRAVDGGTPLPGAWSGPWMRAALVRRVGDRGCAIDLVSPTGIVIETLPLTGAEGVRGAVMVDLERDLSRSKFIRGPEFDHVVKSLAPQLRLAVEQLATEDAKHKGVMDKHSERVFYAALGVIVLVVVLLSALG